MSIKKYLLSLCAATTLMAAQQEQPTPYDLIRPVFPLTWDSTVFKNFDTSVTKKKNMLPKKLTPPGYAPNAYVPDTLDQAYLDAMNTHISPIRVNQAGYLEKDPEKQFFYVGTASSFEVVDIDGNSLNPAIKGTFQPSSTTTSSSWRIVAGTNAATNDKLRYELKFTGPSGTIQVGHIPAGVPTDTRLRIKVGSDISSTFIVSDQVYSMVRNAAIKFYGINRSGYGESWFHPASHTQDGAGGVVKGKAEARGEYHPELAGTLAGGYYDCGDHLKESQTQMYAFAVAAVMAATNPKADMDVYNYNQSETTNLDGIPDMLREAKHGADFVLKAYVRAKGVIDDMALSVGSFGADHGWWGRPENQDKLPVDGSASATDRGGPAARAVRLGEIGSSVAGETAAGLALIAKLFADDYPEYKSFADSCLLVAKQMYAFGKDIATGKTYTNNDSPIVNTPAYSGSTVYHDDLALAAVALLYATRDTSYLYDIVENPALRGGQSKLDFAFGNPQGFFRGGWFTFKQASFFKDGANTDWASTFTYALYSFYKLILKNDSTAASYGISKERRLEYAEDVAYTMSTNVSAVSYTDGATETIVLPKGGGWTSDGSVKYEPMWYTMKTQQPWIYNRYQLGNTIDVLTYADVTKDLEGVALPQSGIQNWKSAEMYQLGINQLNYMLGMNPWDISFIYGVGDKNDAHPHHRAANPEGKNMPGAGYPYKVPVGALLGGVRAGTAWDPEGRGGASGTSWEGFEISEVCLDAAAALVSSTMLVAQEIDKEAAPDISVEIRHVWVDSAIVTVKLTQRGTATISYGTTEGQYSLTATDGAAGVQHDIILKDLKPGTAYYFYVTAANALKHENTKTKYLVDSTQTPFSFTTFATAEDANIQNITVCNVTGDSAEIMWYTPNGQYESKIYWDVQPHSNASEFAYNSGNGNADVSGIPTQFHYVKIGGLKEKTTYYFMVESNGVQVNADENKNLLNFTTPVTWYDFSVRTYQYEWAGKPAINMNIINNEARAFDSLTIRMYMRGDDDLYDDVAIRTDICQAYDEGGFNGPCDEETLAQLNEGFRHVRPVKIEDTYDEKTKTWQWYFPIPLGPTVIKSSSRFRVDVLFVARIRAVGQDDPLDIPPQNKKFYCHSDIDNKWHWVTDLTSQEALDENPGDWSWMPHSRSNNEEKDYPGMSCEEKDAGDIDFNAAAENPYVSVYRKDEFIWGYSPSKKEMETKRAHYEMDVTLDPPFNVSNGSHIDIDQPSSTVHVKGKAHVSEGGFITKVWANGVKVSGMAFFDGLEKWLLNEAGNEIIAKYDIASDMWDLDIPVKMSVGSKKVDITIFAGPNPTCDVCSQNGGCAFENRTYYVNFTKGDATASLLVIKDADGNPVTSPANPEGTVFYIDVKDDDKKKSNASSVEVQVINNKKNDILKVTLNADPANPGHFIGGPITAVNHTKETRNQTSEISFFAGDTIQVVYTDPDDEEDVSKQTFYAESKIPTPQTVLAEDTDCDNKADQLKIIFSNKLTEDYKLDSIKYYIDGMTDTVKLALKATSYAEMSEVIIPIDTSLIVKNANPSGKITTYVSDHGTPNPETTNIADGILPTLESVSILEKAEDDNSDYDTIMVAFSEPVIFSSLSEWPLAVSGTVGTPTVIGKGVSTNNGKSWQFVISGNKDKSLVPIGANVTPRTTGGFTISDQNFNQINANGCKTVAVTLISRPVPIYHAEMIDHEGDGIPDVVYMMFERKLKKKDIFDSVVTVWGDPGITRTFLLPADTSGAYITPKDSTWTIRDTTSAPFTVQIDSVTTKDSVNTYSIIEIKIPASLAYPYGSTSGENDGNGTVSPYKGEASGFFETTYTLYDKCAPVISTARMIKSALTVYMSEPLTVLEVGKYVQRERDEFIPSVTPQISGRSHLFVYDEKDNVFHAGDRVRLVPQTLAVGAAYVDKSNNAPTNDNPYVRITGDDNVRFTVTLVDPVSTPKPGANLTRPESVKNDAFLSIIRTKGKNNFVSKNGSLLGQTDSAAYLASGPEFDIDISMPSASFMTHDGKYMYDYHLKIVMNLYDNLGQYINTYKLDITKDDFAGMRNLVDNGNLKLNLEWAAKDNEAPVAKKGNKIGTGAYIAKFDFMAESFCATTFSDSDNDYKLSCKEVGAKAEKATDSKTKTFGFKRKK